MTSAPAPAQPVPLADRSRSRRDVLRTAGLVTLSGGAVLTLAACGAEGQAGDPVPASAAPATSSAASSTAAPSTSASASASTPPSATSTTASKTPVKTPDGPSVATADVPVGGGVVLDDADFVVTQPTKGTFKAFSKICTHAGCKVAEVEAEGIHCRCHGSVFSISDGSVVNPPARRPLPESATTVSGARVYVTG